MEKFSNILLLIVLLGNIIASLYVFSNGFLIRRTSLNDTNSNRHSLQQIKQFNKSIVLFVDALRFDFIFTSKFLNNDLFGIKTIENLIKNEPRNAKLYKFIADPPTTTMQRIKALTTGTLPTFIDVGRNFDSYMIEDDNIINQLYSNGKSTIILGDDTWLSLFNTNQLASHITYPSFNIKDLDSNDLNVDRELRVIFDSTKYVKWNFIVAHFLGLVNISAYLSHLKW